MFSFVDPTLEEPLTLGKLIDINAVQHEERLQEISGQASSEASLEGILKRVISFLRIFTFIEYKSPCLGRRFLESSGISCHSLQRLQRCLHSRWY